MERKKNQLSELLFLALLVTSLRPPNSIMLNRRSTDRVSFGSDMLGDLLIEDVYQNQFGHDIYSDRHVSNKNFFQDNFDTFSYINSLGRFQPPILPEVNLVAFPVSQAETLPVSLSQFDDSSITESSQLEDFGFDFIQSTLLDDLNDFSNVNDFSDDSLDTIDSFIRESNNEFNGDIQTFQEPIELSFIEDLEIDNNSNIQNDSLVFKNPIEDDDEIFKDSGDGDSNYDDQDEILSDISNLFEEVDLKTLEEEAFGDWMPQATSSAFFTPESSGFYQIGDSGDGCPVYDAIQTQPTSGYSNDNHFGTVLYSSLTTLSNTQSTGTHLSYPNTEEMTYLQNVSNNTGLHVSSNVPECFGCYDDNIAYHHQVDGSVPVAYTANYSSYSQAHSTQYTTSVDGTLSGHYCHSQVAEDCFDKNSDSAVSSMSSERIHTISENEWNETSSNSSRFNADVAISEYSAEQSNKRNNGAQKKYHMFGKRPKSNNTETTVTYRNPSVEQNYIVDYDQQAQQPTTYYPYLSADINSCPENSLQYYQHCVNQNHSYAATAESIISQTSQPGPIVITANEPQQAATITTAAAAAAAVATAAVASTTIIQHEDETIKQQKRSKKSTYSKMESLESHFNRDERRAQMLNIPIPTEDIVNLPIDEFNDRLSKHDLTDLQLSTIRDIRRRGKNKVAAQNCRKRKLDQINYLQSEVVNIVERKSDLMKQINHYSNMIEVTKIKYERLYKFLFDSSAPDSASIRCLPSTSKNNNEHFEMNDESSSSNSSFNAFSKQQN